MEREDDAPERDTDSSAFEKATYENPPSARWREARPRVSCRDQQPFAAQKSLPCLTMRFPRRLCFSPFATDLGLGRKKRNSREELRVGQLVAK